MVGNMTKYTEIMLRLFVGFFFLNIVNGFVLRPQDIVQVFQTKVPQKSMTPTPLSNVEKKVFSPAKILTKTNPSKIQAENMLPKNNLIDDLNLEPTGKRKNNLIDDLNLEPTGKRKKSNPKKRTPSSFPISKFKIEREKPVRKFYPTETKQSCKTSKNLFSSWSRIQFDRKLRKEPYKYFREVNTLHDYDKNLFLFRKKPTYNENNNLLSPFTRPSGNNKKIYLGLDKLFNKHGDFENLRLYTYPRKRVTTTTERVTTPTERDVLYFSMFRNNLKNKYHNNYYINDKIQSNAITDTDKTKKTIYRLLDKEMNKEPAHNTTVNRAKVTANKNDKFNDVFHSSMLKSNLHNTIDTTNFNIIDNKKLRDTDNPVLAEKINSERSHDFRDNANNYKLGLSAKALNILEFPYTLNLIATTAPKENKLQNQNQNVFGSNSIIIRNKKWKGGPNVKFSTYSHRKAPNLYQYEKEKIQNKQRAAIQMQINQSNIRSEKMPQSQMDTQILPNINPDTRRFNNGQIPQNGQPLPYSRKAFVDSDRKEHRRSNDELKTDTDSNENKGIPTHGQKTDHTEFEEKFRLPIKENKLLPIKVYFKDDGHENKQLHEDIINNLLKGPTNRKKAHIQHSKGRVLVNVKIGLPRTSRLEEAHFLNSISADITNNLLPYGFRPSTLVTNQERIETFDESDSNSNDLLDQKKNPSIVTEVSNELNNEIRRYKKSPHLKVFLDRFYPEFLS